MQSKLSPKLTFGVCLTAVLVVLGVGYKLLTFNPNSTSATSDLNVNLVMHKEMTNPSSLSPAQQNLYNSLTADQKSSALAFIRRNMPPEKMSHPIAFNGAGSGGYHPYGNGAAVQ